ncbi:MAG: HlyD family efflux transporter periplasmic adaptor subunit [Candidatus Marithrix sp.]
MEQSHLKWELAAKDIESIRYIEKLKIRSSKVNLEKVKRYEVNALYKVNALNIKADMSGLIQEISENIKLGRWINSGTAIGVIGNVDKMIAEMSMPATFASNVSIGDEVSLNIKGQVVKGEIDRIEQTVKNNQIRFDVKLFGALPKIARTNLEVKGHLSINYGNDILLVDGLSGFTRGVRKLLYRSKNSGIDKYYNKEVRIGMVSGRLIELLSGAEEGDYIGVISE